MFRFWDLEEASLKVLVGLGNPGARYGSTRHNVGFWVMDSVALKLGIRMSSHKFHGILGEGRVSGEKILLVKPQTFMNRSGQCVLSIMNFFQLPLGELLVVYDELALDVGRIRIKGKGSAGGHNGMKSIIESLQSDAFSRLRIGIGKTPPFMDAADYVLQTPGKAEREILQKSVITGTSVCLSWLEEGLDPTMNRFNGKQEEGL